MGESGSIPWERIKRAFHAVLAAPLAERAAALERECGRDAALMIEVQALLNARTVDHSSGRASAVGAAPAVNDLHPTMARPRSEAVGDRIGPYKLLELIGEGGFGSVYIANQDHPVSRRVALKIIKLGMDSAQVVARFEQERQALAMMDHPHIAKVLDGGATDHGRPYFVMELVKGEPITTYCDRENLTIRERMQLFEQVCHAVQHAHTKSIIHRDLKPSNVLVSTQDGRAFAKIIDFGIAKATGGRLTGRTIHTEHHALVGTPEYMSPEQAEGSLDIDTRTDVYSLGVILYELITGSTPFDSTRLRSAGIGEIQRIIREVDPPRPSNRLSSMSMTHPRAKGKTDTPSGGTSLELISKHRRSDSRSLPRLVRGELDWMIMKALDKDRAHRYQTANALAADVRRYLHGEPVLAAPPSARYRVQKFVRRHTGAVAAVAAAVAALALGAVVAGAGWINATVQRSEKEKALAREVRLREDAETARAREAKASAEAQAAQHQAERDREKAEFESYIANLNLADTSLLMREGRRVRERLQACADRHRGWEWSYLSAQSDQSLLTIAGHEEAVRAAAFSPDGRQVLTAAADGTMALWDSTTGAIITPFDGHEGPINTACFGPFGARVLSASDDGTARVWDPSSGREVLQLGEHSGPVVCAEFTQDGGRTLTASSDGTVKVWESSTGRLVHTLECGSPLRTAAFRPDGGQLATITRAGVVSLWNVATGQLEARLDPRPPRPLRLKYSHDGALLIITGESELAPVWRTSPAALAYTLSGHTDAVTSGEFSPDGKRILTASDDATARLWDAATGAAIPGVIQPGDYQLFGASFDASGERIVTLGWRRVSLWSADTLTRLAAFRGHEGWVAGGGFSPDGSRLLTYSEDRTARVWDGDHDREMLDAEHASVVSARLDRSGARFATVHRDGSVGVWDRALGLRLHRLSAKGLRLVRAGFTPDAARLVTVANDHSVVIWDAATGVQVCTRPGGKDWFTVDVNPQGTTMVASMPDWKAVAWNVETGAERFHLAAHQGAVNGAVFSPDGRRLVTFSDDRTARLWDGETGSAGPVLKGHTASIYEAGFSPNSERLVTLSTDRTARVWDCRTGGSVCTVSSVDSLILTALMSPDGHKLLLTCDDKVGRVYDADSGVLLYKLVEEQGGVQAGDFSPDGTRIVTASYDDTARIWETATGRELLLIRRYGGEVKVASFSVDGTLLLSTDDTGNVVVCDSIPFRQRMPELEAARRVQREVRPEVLRRLHAGQTVAEVRQSVATDAMLDDARRRASLAVLARLERHGAQLHAAARRALEHRGAPPSAVDHALAQAREASRLRPTEPFTTTTLGIALYRAGLFEECIATLRRSEGQFAALSREESLPEGATHPENVAYIAMAQHKMGRHEDARATLQLLRELVASPAHADHAHDKVLLRDAEATLSVNPTP